MNNSLVCNLQPKTEKLLDRESNKEKLIVGQSEFFPWAFIEHTLCENTGISIAM